MRTPITAKSRRNGLPLHFWRLLRDPDVVSGIVERLRLHPSDVEAIAAAVVRRLHDDPLVSERQGGWMTASEVAALLKVSRELVYRQAERLGAVRLGDGERPRLRFPREQVEAISASGGGGLVSPSSERRQRRAATASRPPASGFTHAGNPLLPLPDPRR